MSGRGNALKKYNNQPHSLVPTLSVRGGQVTLRPQENRLRNNKPVEE